LSSSKRLLVVLASGSDLERNPANLAFRYAATAAAMDVSVELHIVGESVTLLQHSKVYSSEGIIEKIREMKSLGVRVFVCSAAITEAGITLADMVPEVDGVRGAASLLAAGMAGDTRMLSF
jgi:predicted peroxiredoxin